MYCHLQNLSELHSAARRARKTAASQALEWATSIDSTSSPRPRPSTSSSSTPLRTDSHTSNSQTSDSKGKERARDSLLASTSVYKGFGIAPPRSYAGGKAPSTHQSNSSHPSHTSIVSTKTPYARPPPPLQRPTPVRPPPQASTPRPSALANISTPSRAASSPFRPPSFTRPISTMTEGGTTPDSAKRKTLGTSGGPSSAMVRKSLLLDWNKFNEGGKEGEEGREA